MIHSSNIETAYHILILNKNIPFQKNFRNIILFVWELPKQALRENLV